MTIPRMNINFIFLRNDGTIISSGKIIISDVSINISFRQVIRPNYNIMLRFVQVITTTGNINIITHPDEHRRYHPAG
jgi:hypothetical protein